MKRTELVEKLIKEGFSEKTLVKFSDNQLKQLASRMLSEEDMMISKKDPQYQQKVDSAKKQNKTIEAYEELKGNQHKIDKNHNGKIDAEDFAMLNKEKKSNVEEGDYHNERSGKALEKSKEDFPQLKNIKKCDECGKVGTKCKCKKDVEEEVMEIKSKKCNHCNKEMSKCSCDDSHLEESNKIKNWVKGLVENKEFHSFTSKNEIMELIQTKLNESDTMVQHGPKVKKGHNGIPEFMSYDAIVSAEPKTAPSKPAPSTKPGTKPTPTRREDPRKTPFQPGPGPNPKPKAKMAEEKKVK
jgi:hypothetical protein